MLNITRSLILSKIDYALPIYGWCAPSHVKLIQGPYHAAIRRSIGAFRTSPITNILAESGFPSIAERVSFLTHKLVPKLFICRNKILFEEVKKSIKHKRLYRLESIIDRCVNFSRELNIETNPLYVKQALDPPWTIAESSFILSMIQLPKSTTPTVVYNQTFGSIVEPYVNDNWNLLFTDGSKSHDATTFAIVRADNQLIKTGYISNHCSNFTAEAYAIFLAVEFAAQRIEKYIICTDSLSSLHAIKSSKYDSPLINDIRHILGKFPNKIKLMWVPSHVGISGNEYADIAASEAKTRPLLQFQTWESRDIFNTILSHFNSLHQQRWSDYQHSYKLLNPVGKKPNFPKTCPRNMTSAVVRLRIGHCKFSHKHLLEKLSTPMCALCNTQLNVSHLLDECPKYSSSRQHIFGSNRPSDLLKVTCDNNIKLIWKFISVNNLQHQI